MHVNGDAACNTGRLDSTQPKTTHRELSATNPPAAAGGYRGCSTPGQPSTHPRTRWHKPALHLPAKTTIPASHKHPHGEGVAEYSRRNQIYGAYCSLLSPRPSGILRTQSAPLPQQPSSPAAFCPRHPTLTCWPFDLGAAQSRPRAVQAGVASFALGVSSLPPRRVPGQSAAQPVPLSPFPCPSLPVSPFARPTPLRRSAWLEPGCFACLAAPRPRHRRWPIVSPPHPHQVCYRAHTNPGSDKHACRLGNPLPLAKHVSCLQGRPRGGGECHPLASPDRLPTHEDDTIDPDTRCLFRASLPPRRPTLGLCCFRACAGHTANKYVPHCGPRSVVAWPRNALPPCCSSS